MNNILKSTLAVAVAGMALASCSDWTEPEAVKVNYDDITNADPTAYAQYLENLRAYRTNGHQKMYAWFENKASFTSQADHVSTVPDSIDVLVFTAPKVVFADILNEMVIKRQNTGMEMAWEVSYQDIRASWDNKNLQADIAEADGQPRPEVPAWSTFLADSLATSLSYGELYGFNRMIVAYDGKAVDVLPAEDQQAYRADQEAFLNPVKSWLNSHQGVAFDFRGVPANLTDPTWLSGAGVIFLSESLKATGTTELQFILNRNSKEGVPADRFAMMAALPLNDPDMASVGHWRYDYSTVEVARWSRAKSDIRAMGMTNLNDGYYNPTFIYPVARLAIQTLNPAAK